MTFSESYFPPRIGVAPIQVQCLVMRASPDDDEAFLGGKS